MARPGRWSRTWTGILAPVRSRKSPCPAAGLRKGSLLAVVLALQVLGLPVPDHVFGVAIPVATTGFPQPVRPLCYDEGVLVRVCSRIGGRPHLAARRGGGAGRASAQGPGRCRRVCWQHLDQPALVPTVAAGVPSWHISAPALLVDAGRSDAGGPASRGRSRPPRRPGRLGALPGQRQLGHQQRAGQPGRDGHQTSSSSPDSTASGASASVAAAGGGRPAPALPPGRVEATHALGFANGRRVAERLGIDLADPAAGRRPVAKRGGVTTSGRLRCGRAPARVPCCSGLSRGLCVVVPIVVPISRAVSSIGRAADF